MSEVLWGTSLFLLLNLVAGLVRVLRGPTLADRVLTAQLFGSTGVAILLILAEELDTPALRNVALVLALLAAVVVVAFVRHAGSSPDSGEDAAT
jgi:multicomponent Na+:H+ antiporter subunit F